jgi:hypothetical protein
LLVYLAPERLVAGSLDCLDAALALSMGTPLDQRADTDRAPPEKRL